MSAKFVECRNPNPDPRTWSSVQGDSVGNRIRLDKPVPTVFCKRQKGHVGDCAAFAFSITEPTRWAGPVTDPDEVPF